MADGRSIIEHTYLDINGLRLHVAMAGAGEKGAVVLLHGFPEIWYSWRHQLIALADAGFRAIAPDFRGYGLSEQPQDPENASWDHLNADLLVILDSLSIPKAFIIGKDFGCMVASSFALQHRDRTMGLVKLGVPFVPSELASAQLPEGFYVSRWIEPGRAEKDFGRFPVGTVVRNVYILFSGSQFPNAREDQEIMDLVDPSALLPDWFTEEDLKEYTSLYEKSGFRYPMQMPYRALGDKQTTPNELKIEVPSLLIMGEKDYVLEWPGMDDYIRSGKVKHFVPDLEVIFVPGGSHFVQEQFPAEVNKLIITFLDNIKQIK